MRKFLLLICQCVVYATYGQAPAPDVLIPIAAPTTNYVVKTIQNLPDGGYMLAGLAGEVTDYGNEGIYFDVFVLNVDANGHQRYMKIFGGPEHDFLEAAVALPDGSVWCAMTSRNTGGDKKGRAYGDYDAWIAKLDPQGNLVAQQTYGTDAQETAVGIQLNTSGKLVLTAWVGKGKGRGSLKVAPGLSTLWAAVLDPQNGQLITEKTYQPNLGWPTESYMFLPDVVGAVPEKQWWVGCWSDLKAEVAYNGKKLYSQNIAILDVNTLDIKALNLREYLEIGMNLNTLLTNGRAIALHSADTASGLLYDLQAMATVTQLAIPPLQKVRVGALQDGGFVLWGEPGMPAHITEKPYTEKAVITVKDKKGNEKKIELDARPMSQEELKAKVVAQRYYALYPYDAEGKVQDRVSLTLPAEEKLLKVQGIAAGKVMLVRARYATAEEAGTVYGTPGFQLVLQLADVAALR